MIPKQERAELLKSYSTYVLEHGKRPDNVYQFTKSIAMEENMFYTFYASFASLEADYLHVLFERSVEVCNSTTSYQNYAVKESLLDLYYIFFENMALNRSFILYLLQGPPHQRLMVLGNLKKPFLTFLKGLAFGSLRVEGSKTLQRYLEKGRYEALWLHFVSAVEFWMKDNSADFVDTDIYIEKSLDTASAVLENPAAKKVVDFGKFMFHKNKMW